MSRAKVHALAIVNWRGVFYERYAFDPAVTALEGSNGAGKTTVMIAAYVALFPDLGRLRFTNLGEHEALRGDRGIYGRLGLPGWPSLAVLDLHFGKGERLLAGVKIERKTEPVVELEPFLVSGLGPDVRLQDVLLDRVEEGERTRDRLLDRTRLVQRVARAGGLLRWREPHQYFQELFEKGVLPLRLAADEERGRFNEMLRTSMIGGISRTLSGGLRDFVLREDGTLAESLRTMRENLAACQVTRREVEDSAKAQVEIQAVYGAGERMFTHAAHAARVRDEEQQVALEAAKGKVSREDEARRSAEARVTELDDAIILANANAEERERAAATARAWTERVNRGVLLVGQRDNQARGCDQLRADTDAMEREERTLSAATGTAKKRRDAAMTERDGLSSALASARQQWHELARRAGLYEEATRRRAALVQRHPGFDLADVDALRAEAEARRAALDVELATLRRGVGEAEAARRQFGVVAQALDRVVAALAVVGEAEAGPIGPQQAAARGTEVDRAIRELRALVADRRRLGEDLRNAQIRATAQRALRDGIAALGEPLTSRADVEAAEAGARARREELDGAMGVAEKARDAAKARLDAARGRISAAVKEIPRWDAAQARASALSEHFGAPIRSIAELDSADEDLRAREHAARERANAADVRAAAAKAEADALASGAGGLDPALVDACGLVDGELVAGRFEDVSVEDAAGIEARLGPLRAGVLVADPERAAAELAASGHLPPEVWLLKSIDEARLPGQVHGEAAIVASGEAVRVTRLPERPVLGKAARGRRVRDLLANASQFGDEASAAKREAARAAELSVQARALRTDSARWLAPDPRIEAEAARVEAATANGEREEAEATLRRVEEDRRAARRREEALRPLVGKAWLLDEPDAAAFVVDLTARVARADRVSRALERCATDAEVLATELPTLRHVPPDAGDVERMSERLRAAEREREASDNDARDFAWLEANREALTWSDAPGLLRDAQAAQQALVTEHARAVDRATQAEAAWEAAQQASQAAELALGAARLALGAAEQKLAEIRTALEGLGVGEPGDADLAAAATQEKAARAAVSEARAQALHLAGQRGSAAAALEQACQRWDQADKDLRAAEGQARPAREAWAAFRAEIERRGFVTALFADAVLQEVHGKASIHLSREALTAQRGLLVELRHAQRGAAVAEVVAAGDAAEDSLRWEHYVKAWAAVREWVRERIPPQVSETDDPVAALRDLGRHLVGLRSTLERQEDQLRGNATTVANHIGGSLKRANRLIGQLNDDLEEVHFGSIRRVKVETRRIAGMNKLLDALRGEDAQAALFRTDVPLEQALASLYQRETGGRIAGEKLLDYREYLQLRVLVQRAASTDWEEASATRMSTGEAIGVGAALMMVVLAAWERRDNLGRAAKKHGSLRFLFLDEANRLSLDNLKTLFELCDNLELQLLVAAPEVAHAEGNITYRLERRVVGNEEVVDVVGRRVEA